MQRPNLYIIAGPNGAGKTTAAYNLLPDILHCIDNLIHLYLPVCDSVLVYNNIQSPAQLVARKKSSTSDIEVVEEIMWNRLLLKI